MTPERLAEIKARADEATEGPWSRYGWWCGHVPPGPVQGTLEAAPGLSIGSVAHTESIARFSGYQLPVEANADFCAHARTDVPDLLAEIELLQAQINSDTAAMDAEIDRSSREAQDLRDAREDALRAGEGTYRGSGNRD